ncbi:RNA 2',3'-cyclic phosphodiesterase [Candidatus Micrarchaeota archaeon]|nr:RNA 2',3'-cyclic phosphodiesterase [Candidatus Micrarchaeota archaeon]
MKRLFVAVELPEELRNRIHSLAGELPQDAVKAVEKENIHLTLKFLGDTPESKVAEIIERLEGVSSGPFRCAVSGAGVFPNPDYIRVVWVGLHCEEMPKLAAEVERALEGIGKKEERGFSPHITIARVRKKIDVSAFLAKHASENFGGFGASEFVLIGSELGREGPTYTAIKRFSLER